MRSDKLEKGLGRRVRNAWFNQNLTQAEVAERANVSLGALKHLESGSGATVYTLVKVLRALDQVDWIDSLAPETEIFNQLDLLSAREAEQGTRPRRVRRPWAATPEWPSFAADAELDEETTKTIEADIERFVPR